MDELETMARNFYGYGRWSTPFWFIGLEQGGSNNLLRAKAFKELQSDGLCDCEEFHKAIAEFRWHRKPAEKASLNPTWRRLMLLLMPALGLGNDQLTLRKYQANDWGRGNGNTCVIELGGLAARNSRAESDRKSFRDERIRFIKKQMKECMPEPKLVVMYGAGSKDAWKAISGCNFNSGTSVKPGKTLFAFMQSPTAVGQRDELWISLGARIAECL